MTNQVDAPPAGAKDVEEIDSDIEFVSQPTFTVDVRDELKDEAKCQVAKGPHGGPGWAEMVLPPRGLPQMLHPHVPKTEEPHRLLDVQPLQRRLSLDESSVSLLADNIADALIAQVKLQLDKMRALVANGTEPTVAPPLAEHLPSPRWTAGTLGVVGGHRSNLYRSSSKGPEFHPISEESQCCPEEASCVSSASRRDPDLNMYDLNINPDLSQSDFSERDAHSRLQKGASKCSTPSKRSENRFDPARARKLAKAAMTLRESPLESEIHNLGGGGALEQPGRQERNLAENLADILPMRRSTLTSRHDTVIPTIQAGRKTVQVLPNSVSGAWRRQAKVLAAQMREEMAEEVKMAKNNMSFRGGLWWLRQLARYISLIAASLTLAAVSFSFYWEGSEVFIARNLLDAAVVASAVMGLLIHHFCSKLSENCLSAGEQDGLLQAHSVAFGYTQPWLVISRDHGNHLLPIWICSVISRVDLGSSDMIACQTRSVESYLRVQTVATGLPLSVISQTSMHFEHRRFLEAVCCTSAFVIQYMQELSSEDVSFEGMAQEWNTIQIFVRTLCDGCSYSLALQVGMIPVMAASTIFRILWSDSNMVDMVFSLLPFFATSLMPFHALVTAASTTQQCEQSPQVANSMLVSEWDNSMSQDLLAFMSRCDIGFFINDLRVTPAAVMKSTYVLVGVLVTIEVKPDDLDDTERLPKEHRSGAERSGAPVERAARPCDQESEAWPQLFPPANTSAQARHDAEKAAAVAMQAGDFTGAINVYTEAMRSGGSNPQMLCTRSALLLKMKRPCAAIRDCTAALKINNHMVKAYRLRGMAHRRLGHWKKAYRDLTEAQHLKFDPDTSDMHKLVAGKLGVTPTGPKTREDSPKKRSKARESPPPRMSFPDPIIPEIHFPAPVAAPDPPLEKGQAVLLIGLQRAPQLNGRRGVVEREDPRPASKGRWEVEIRMDGGGLEVKSIKRENIQTLNKVDREACKAWAKAEKMHKEARDRREQQEEIQKYKNVVEAKLSKLTLTDKAKDRSGMSRDLLRTLGPEQALSVLDRCEGPSVTNVSGFVITQAKLLLGQDSDSEGDGESQAKKARSE
eukprot:s1793_g11.t1